MVAGTLKKACGSESLDNIGDVEDQLWEIIWEENIF